MGFYKNTKAQILKLEGRVDYPIGTVVKYGGAYGEVCTLPTGREGFLCSKSCIFYKYCDHEIMGIYCSPENRSDERDVYFKEIKL